MQYSPRVPATKLLTQIRNQQSEGLKNKRMSALGVVLNSLLEDLVDSLMAVICALLLYRMGHPIGDSIGCRHDCVWECVKTDEILCTVQRVLHKQVLEVKRSEVCRKLVERDTNTVHRRRAHPTCSMPQRIRPPHAHHDVLSQHGSKGGSGKLKASGASRSAGGWRQRSLETRSPSADSTNFGERGAALRLAIC